MEDVDLCVLEPNGTFYVKGKSPSSDEVERGEMMAVLTELMAEVKALRLQVEAKG